jgi:hypothetical protein
MIGIKTEGLYLLLRDRQSGLYTVEKSRGACKQNIGNSVFTFYWCTGRRNSLHAEHIKPLFTATALCQDTGDNAE